MKNGSQVGTAPGTTTRADKVLVQFMDASLFGAGKYSKILYWVPGVGWSYNGSAKHTDTIVIGKGGAIVVQNYVKANTSTGVESYSPIGTDFVKIDFMHSGEVDLVAQTAIPANAYGLAGNTSFSETLSIDDFAPYLPNGSQVGTAPGTTTRADKVLVQFMDDALFGAGKYSKILYWVPGVGWSYNGSAKHTDTIRFAPGTGFVVQNYVKVNTSTGVESYSPIGTDFTPILIKVVEDK